MSVQSDFQEKKEWFNVRKTVLEMLQDRGNSIPEEVSIVNFEQFSIKYDTDNIDMYINDEIKNKKIYVHFNINLNKKFGKSDLVETLKKVVGTYKDENINLILLLREKENSTVTKELERKQYENVEIFLKKNMMFNITHHEIVPRHILLNQEEVDMILKQYQTTRAQLPKLLTTDPVAKYYGMKAGDVCKIIRQSPMTGESYYYRILK